MKGDGRGDENGKKRMEQKEKEEKT